ncbi:13 kda deflagellation-inducible protein [Cyclospora cayetanensis]|uniref:13 kDa deflagellation-inducible protein n=1 Tax=Cyclospora cayetanensis TaxID=88456 RepID=A0A1D3D306_9EIME|nr:13 kda deflagellation-inducible protein [Cyclospora cayetanensis]
MAISNTNLHNYNHELVQCIDDLKRKRDEVNRQIEEEEQDKEKIQREIELLQERLQRIKAIPHYFSELPSTSILHHIFDSA